MNILAMTTLMLMAGAAAHGESDRVAGERRVALCVDGMAPQVVGAVMVARTVTSRMFADIGVTIDWRRGLSGCPAQGIQIDVALDTPDSLIPGALAYALPYEGTHIVVFYERIARCRRGRSQVSIVLGYVLAHEITHILQGVDRHSESGVMKARWDVGDYDDMFRQELKFEPHDITLIYAGLEARAGRDAAIR